MATHKYIFNTCIVKQVCELCMDHKEIEISLPILKFQKNSSTISDLV